MAPKRTIAEVGGKKAAGAGSGKKAAAKPAAKPAAAAPKKAAASAPAKKQTEKKAEKKKQSTSLPQPEFTADEFEAIFQALSAHPAAKWCSEDDIEDMIDELERWWFMRWLQANPSELTELVHLENESDLAEVLPSGPLGISPALDDAWRAQISNTKLYSDFCTRHFGSFVHHEDDSAIEEEVFEDSYEATIKLLYLVFGPSGLDELPDEQMAERLWPGLLEMMDDYDEEMEGEEEDDDDEDGEELEEEA